MESVIEVLEAEDFKVLYITGAALVILAAIFTGLAVRIDEPWLYWMMGLLWAATALLVFYGCLRWRRESTLDNRMSDPMREFMVGETDAEWDEASSSGVY